MVFPSVTVRVGSPSQFLVLAIHVDTTEILFIKPFESVSYGTTAAGVGDAVAVASVIGGGILDEIEYSFYTPIRVYRYNDLLLSWMFVSFDSHYYSTLF
jgi:hypothetical protein